MSVIKDLKKQHKKLETQIKKITKTRLNDRTSSSWILLKQLKKKKLQLKDKIIKLSNKFLSASIEFSHDKLFVA
jgi:hypothetical protein